MVMNIHMVTSLYASSHLLMSMFMISDAITGKQVHLVKAGCEYGSYFTKYIAGENATGRVTTGFMYKVANVAAQQVNDHFKNLIGNHVVKRAFGDYMKEYQLAEDYHALTNNCTTSMAGARVALIDLDFNVKKYNEGRGLSMSERVAAHVAGWPVNIFMPADLQEMLAGNQNHRPDKIEQFGGKK